jgi:hypothetical protein
MDIIMISLTFCLIAACLWLCINIVYWTKIFRGNEYFSHPSEKHYQKISKTPLLTIDTIRLFPWPKK